MIRAAARLLGLACDALVILVTLAAPLLSLTTLIAG